MRRERENMVKKEITQYSYKQWCLSDAKMESTPPAAPGCSMKMPCSSKTNS